MRYLRALLTFARFHPYVPAPGWTDEDAARFTVFLESDTGKRLKQSLLNASIRQNSAAVSQRNELPYACGYANGFLGAIAALQSYAISSPIETVDPDSSSDLDHLNP